VADSIRTEGGIEAVQLRVAEQYVVQFGNLAKVSNTVVVPATVSDLAGMIAAAMKVFNSASPVSPRSPGPAIPPKSAAPTLPPKGSGPAPAPRT
jgi:hypothetical protein